MKKILLLAFLLIPACGFIQSIPTIRHAQESVVTVNWDSKDEKGEPIGSRCTGFQVGIVWALTAKHCLPEDEGIDVYVNGEPARVIKTSDSLALLQTEVAARPILSLRTGKLEIGEAISSIGYAQGGPLATFRRYFSNYTGELGGNDHIVLDGPISGGMSGGPMIDKDGKVVGINQATDKTRSIGCSAEEIKDFLK
jgi:hypothetical protein